MRSIDIAVVGSGMGGAMIAALQDSANVVVFEKDYNVGGCASTFCKKGHFYNAGATTFVGYEAHHPIKALFERIDFVPDIKPSPIAIRIVQGNKIVDRVQDFEAFLEGLSLHYPHPNNRLFWHKIKTIDQTFWQLQHLHYEKYSLKGYLKSAKFLVELLVRLGGDLFQSASSFIQKHLPHISPEYLAFIDAQLLITVQSTSAKVSLLSMALGLSYPFHEVYYANGGMGKIIEGILQNVEVKTHEAIQSIKPHDGGYLLHTSKGSYCAKNIILNSTVYDSAKLFDDLAIQNYYNQYRLSDQSAFTLYLHIESKEEFLHHYQIIVQEPIPHCLSQSFFVSFSDSQDTQLSQGGYSVTLSTHTQALFWQNLTQEEYRIQKTLTQEYIMQKFLEHFDTISPTDITQCFSATSTTFKRYIGRLNCGGKAITIKNMLTLPTPNTPFKGLYHVGDTLFGGQGWPGVALGVKVLDAILKDTKQ
ncbi:MAG: carotenoid isomerase [Sulfurovum sp. FS08-3]|nr:MAG: carotenoid isomerase [Sulfurovum sp. FS08-3]